MGFHFTPEKVTFGPNEWVAKHQEAPHEYG